ncbi:MAG: sigma-70 family RNA polymerase sigma factor [Clostridiales bacterium]|nr:sigma-70 family RNA polymerase sigma factor [Clostridiales bacterium]
MTDFDRVYDLYFKDVYKYALSLSKNEAIAEELTQETFFKALEKIDGFDGKCKLFVWLCQIAKNTYFSMCRKEKHLDREAEEKAEKSGGLIEQELMSREDAFEIHRILHMLEEPYKEVFSLRVFGELSFGQIAELFGKTESWARVTYHRAKIKIREEMQ